jgi:hypothetical protein
MTLFRKHRKNSLDKDVAFEANIVEKMSSQLFNRDIEIERRMIYERVAKQIRIFSIAFNNVNQ